MRQFRIFLITLILTASTNSQAGWLHDKMAERAAERAESSEMDAADAGGSTLPASTRMLKDLAYGSNKAQKLDVYLPAGKIEKAPVIFMVHGGAWRIGDKGAGKVVDAKAARWLPRGFIFISANYRMLPDADPLEQANDVARALAYAQKHAAEWGGDATQFVLMGHSAGAHLVSLLSANPALASAQGAKPWLGTVSLDSAAMDVTAIMQGDHYRFYDTAFGKNPAYWQKTSPIAQVHSSMAPMLLVCSSVRPDKPCEQAEAFAAAVQRQGGSAEVLPQALKHGAINGELGKAHDYTHAVEDFMQTLSPTIANRLASRN